MIIHQLVKKERLEKKNIPGAQDASTSRAPPPLFVILVWLPWWECASVVAVWMRSHVEVDVARQHVNI